MSRRVLGLAIAPAPDPLLRRFLSVCARWTSVRHADRSDAVDAWLVTDDVDPRRVSPDHPTLLWTQASADRSGTAWPDAIVIGPHCDRRIGMRVPDPSVDLTMTPYAPPLIRDLWRRRYGMPEDLVLRIDDAAPLTIPPPLRLTALTVATVVIATGDAVLAALASGAPTVTDHRTAERLQLGSAVEAVAESDLEDAASRLTRSAERLADLAWRGRRLVEGTFDLPSVAYSAIQRAGLSPYSDTARDAVLMRLDELWATPANSWSIIHAISR